MTLRSDLIFLARIHLSWIHAYGIICASSFDSILHNNRCIQICFSCHFLFCSRTHCHGSIFTYSVPLFLEIFVIAQVRTRASLDGAAFGRLPRLVSFAGARVSVRRADGASMTAAVSPFAAQLHALCAHAQFAKAVCGMDIFSENEMFPFGVCVYAR